MTPEPTANIENPDREAPHKPRLNGLLRTLRLDISYERGAGDYLYYRDDSGREVEVLDLVGGYGSLLLGHSHPVLVEEARRVLMSGRPMHAQGSRRELAGRLARELSDRSGGGYAVTFGNSGAEAVEAAMKHAMLETGGRTFISLEGGFHGKTLGALQLTANPQYREPFELSGLRVLRVPANDVERLAAAFAEATDLAGFIFEPILGEGGIHPLEAGFLRRARELCQERNVPLIADECQTGLGRTGTFLAMEASGVRADYLILSKSLGGGLAKISALLVDRSRYRDEFDLQHTSTFAEDDFSCAVALKALELLDPAMLAACHNKGLRLLEGLRSLQARFPNVMAEVRGRGLMMAVEFCRQPRSSSFLLRYLSSQEDLGYLVAGYLLNVHRIRMAPTLSDRFTLRLEPSAGIKDEDIGHFLEAMEDVCRRLSAGDALGLTRFVTQGRPPDPAGRAWLRSDIKFSAFDEERFRISQRHSPPLRVGWLCHLIDADDFVPLEPAFASMSFGERARFVEHWLPRAAPVVMSAVDVRSLTGASVRLLPILLPFTSQWIKQQLEARQPELAQELIQRGIDLAASLNCQVVSLGQYTSIATLNGLRTAPRGMGLTTGNSYALALALEAIARAARNTGRPSRDSVLVVAGAAGNIGRTCAEILSPHYRRTILLGSAKPGSWLRLRNFAGRLPRTTATTDPSAIADGDVVVVALNAVDAPLAPDLFRTGATVCDLSVPAALPSSVARRRPDLCLIKGGIVSLPFGEDLEIVGFPLPRGQTYGCMAEAILLGLEGERGTTFTGSLTADHVARVSAMAARHGFALADYKTDGVSGTETKEEPYVHAG